MPFVAIAQDYDLSSKTRVRVEAQPRKMKGFVAIPHTRPIAPAEPSLLKWNGSLDYAIRTDLADRIRPRLYQHSLTLTYGLERVPWAWSLAGRIQAGYESAGEERSEVLVNQNNKELFINNFELITQKVVSGPADSSWRFSLGNEFPTSPHAQRENYASVTSLEVVASLPIFIKRFNFRVGSEFYYIWNRYEFSPATGDLNKQGGWRGDLQLRWDIWRQWYISGQAGAQVSRYLDGTNDLTYRNSISTGYNWSHYAVWLSTSNGTYLDRSDAFIWFVDEYRRMLALGLIYKF